jgi:hypothetical protein
MDIKTEIESETTLQISFYDHTLERPSKLLHIKNQIMLDNTLNPLNKKYVKKIYAHKLNKLGNDNRRLIWEYYKDRKKHNIAKMLLKAHYLNMNDVTIIYFSDPVQYKISLAPEMINELKKYSRNIKEYRELSNQKTKKKKEK